jgi:hypothetical protein
MSKKQTKKNESNANTPASTVSRLTMGDFKSPPLEIDSDGIMFAGVARQYREVKGFDKRTGEPRISQAFLGDFAARGIDGKCLKSMKAYFPGMVAEQLMLALDSRSDKSVGIEFKLELFKSKSATSPLGWAWGVRDHRPIEQVNSRAELLLAE